MNRLSIINSVAQAIKAQTYIEIGVNTGEVFFSVHVRKKIAVDPYFKFSGRAKLHRIPQVRKLLYKNHEHFYEMSSDDFFAEQSELMEKFKPDLSFIDGLHTYGQTYKDVMNCLKYLSPKGVIIVHDTNPICPAFETPAVHSIQEVLDKANKGEIPGWTGNWSGDVWKAIVRLQCEREDLSIFTLDIDWGVTIITRKNNANKLSVKDIDSLNYKDLDQNRVKWLNLKKPDFLEELIQGLTC